MSNNNTKDQPKTSTKKKSATHGNLSKTKEEWPLVYEPGRLGDFGLVFNQYGPGVAEPRRIQGLVKGPATDGDLRRNKVPTWASVAYILLSRNPKPPVMGLNCIFRTALEWIPDLANQMHPESTQALRSVFVPSRKANIYFRQADSNTGNNGHHQIMEAAEEDPEAAEGAPAPPRRRRRRQAARAKSEASPASQAGSRPSSKTMSSPIEGNKSSAPTSQDDKNPPSKKRGAKKAAAPPTKKRKVLKAPPIFVVPQIVEELADDWQVRWAGLTDKEQLEMLKAAEMLVLLSQGSVETLTPRFEVEDDIYNASPPPSRQTRRSNAILCTGL